MSEEKVTPINEQPEPTNPPPVPVEQAPTCPSCRQPLIAFTQKVVTLAGGFATLMVCCPNANCRALLSLNVFGQAVQVPKQPHIIPSTMLPRFDPTKRRG